MAINSLTLGDEKFPAILKEIPRPPEKIYCLGKFETDNRPHIAIVGTRKATTQGQQIAKKFAKELASAGIVIVSGLAMGIDTAVHEGALESNGRTIAVLANGLDWIYPRQNEKLGKRILESGGAILSEYPAGTPAYKDNFLARNRIVSGLSLGVIVVEAPVGSGALSTANHALEQNREVFVVPGPLNNENYVGSHALIRAGARLVTGAGEVLEDLNLSSLAALQQSLPIPDLHLDEKQKAILAVLKNVGEPVNIDKIGELMEIDVSTINRSLTFLLIKNLIKEEGGRYHL